MTTTKTLCPAAPDGMHTFIYGRCIECDVLEPQRISIEEYRRSVVETLRVAGIADRLVGDAAR